MMLQRDTKRMHSDSGVTKRNFRGYSLWDLLITSFIVILLASVLVTQLRGSVDDSKWTEGITAAGMIQNVTRVYHAQTGIPIIGRLNNDLLMEALNLEEADLKGRFFVPGDYEVIGVDANGKASVRVTGSLPQAPAGSKVLYGDGHWE